MLATTLEPKTEYSDSNSYKSKTSHNCAEGKANPVLGPPVHVDRLEVFERLVHCSGSEKF